MEYCEGDLGKLIEAHKKSKKLIEKNVVLNIIKNLCLVFKRNSE